MTKAINTEGIEKATGRLWSEWVKELDKNNAQRLSHAELSRFVFNTLEGAIESPGWWAQSIAVAYEQHTGKRLPGQLANGLFELAVSKMINTPRATLFSEAVVWLERQKAFNGQLPLRPRSSETPKRSNWRCDFEDGSKFAATVEQVGDKSKLVLSHTDVPTEAEAATWKAYWRHITDVLAK